MISIPFGTGRSISLIGILGGVLLILLLLAFIIFIRRRKRWTFPADSQEDSDRLSHHLNQLRLSQNLLGLAREAPPDYSTACKQKEEEEAEELPSYSQAIQREPRTEEV